MKYLFLLPLLPTTLIAAFELLAAANGHVIRKIKRLPLDDATRDAAVHCMRKAHKEAMRRTIYSATAPLVVAIALLFTKRSANRLPRLFWRWDNNESINGDGDYVQDGDVQVHSRLYGPWTGKEVLIHPDDADDTARAYYAKHFHPRSFMARWIWMGWRNRASKYAWDRGVFVRDAQIVAGEEGVLNNTPGVLLLKAGVYYQFKEQRPGKRLTRHRNYGLKLEYVRGDKHEMRVPYTTIGNAWRRTKKG